MSDAVTIAGGRLAARIRAQGAELTSLTHDGAERMWQADPAVWGWHAPNLFPIVGALPGDRLTHRGRTYTLPSHGFLRHTACELIARDAVSCTWRLTESAETLAVYPFRFVLEIRYAIEGDALTGRIALENPGDEPLIASLGLHPAFQWPLVPGRPREDYRLVFEHDEPAPIRRIAGKLLAPEPEPTPVRGRVLALHDGLFANDAVIMDRPASRALTFGAPGGPAIAMDWDGLPHLGIWTKPGAGYLCIEPWQGHASPAGFEGEFKDKPGTVSLAPGTRREWRYRIRPLDRFPGD
ncbi:MAG TPA: aldose 1-epimerase family protein [Aliidongia sp.]|nr:aldose 1-epimerase family protein [Aliidongia sp.]